MDLHTWLDKPAHRGQAKALAELLGVSAAAVSLWRDNGVPMDHMPAIVRFSGGAVKIVSMVEHALAARARSKARAERQVA